MLPVFFLLSIKPVIEYLEIHLSFPQIGLLVG
jgi:hypothetical protein